MRDTRIDMEPKAMGQLKAEAAKAAHDTLMAGEDSSFLRDAQAREESDRQLIKRDELKEGLLAYAKHNGLTRDNAYSYLLVANRGAW